MKPKGRPRKKRSVQTEPTIKYFSPRGKPGRPDEIELKIEEFEAIRLTDYTELDQRKAAEKMHISQQTFSRILRSARKHLANGLVNGKIIRIIGGASSS